jgi:glycosyltransferase involved in cell wall biosynthesis
MSALPQLAKLPAVVAPPAHPTAHLLFIIDGLCGMGGAERVLLTLARRLPEHGFCCSVATFAVDPDLPDLKNLPCPLHVFPMKRTYGWQGLKTARKLRRLIRSERFEVVHTFFETSDIFGGLVAKLSGARVLVSSRRDMGILRSAKHRVAYRFMGRLFDQVQTVSEQVRDFCIREDRLKPERVVTLYNGIDLQNTATENTGGGRSAVDLNRANHRIVTVGNIRRVKGIDVLVRAAAQVCQRYPGTLFLVVGEIQDAQYYQELLSLARSLNIFDNMKFLGPSRDVFSVLRQSDIFCLLSRNEGFSNAVLEAMGCGLPCVVTDVGGNREAISEGRNGFLVPSEDAEAAAARILTLIENPKCARQMGQLGRVTVEEKFTTDAMITRLVSLYHGLLGRCTP